MSPVETITAALAVGADATMNGAASTDVQDTYASLKALLRLRLDGQDSWVVSALDEEYIEAKLWHEHIGDVLDESRAAADKQVLEVAGRLLAIVQGS